ncbi:hypothetical protein B481_0640 [Planococcus halocryophilus Or1]|nr:hypothetical protein [Planococcus halocryophilus]EMF47638.1 hypothetical protein B481_0640 [Planococcus halocryophilus Or1]
MSFMDDLIWAISALLKLFGYFLVGVIIVSIVMYGLAGLFDLITHFFY